MERITDARELIGAYCQKYPASHFFDRDTLKFFGETRSTMRLLKGTCEIRDSSGEPHECYTLSSLQRNHPLGPRRVYHHFDVGTLKEIVR